MQGQQDAIGTAKTRADDRPICSLSLSRECRYEGQEQEKGTGLKTRHYNSENGVWLEAYFQAGIRERNASKALFAA